MRAAEVAFMGAFVQANPWLMPVLQEHLDDNDGILPHLLLADVERWVEARFAEHGGQDADLRAVLSYLDAGYAAEHPHVQELIAVSFLELLPRPEEPLAQLRSLVGPQLRGKLDVIG